jgi:type II secretory pathway pseudopilin PulG
LKYFTKKEHGFSLVESLVSLSIVASISGTLMFIMKTQKEYSIRKRYKSKMSHIYQKIYTQMQRIDNLHQTLAIVTSNNNNNQLSYCADTSHECSASAFKITGSKSQKSINIINAKEDFNANVTTITKFVDKWKIAGTIKEPVYYDLIKGTRCHLNEHFAWQCDKESCCIVKAVAYAWATCPAKFTSQAVPTTKLEEHISNTPKDYYQSSCKQAETLHFRLQVSSHIRSSKLEISLKKRGIAGGIKSIPADHLFSTSSSAPEEKRSSFSFQIPVSEFGKSRKQGYGINTMCKVKNELLQGIENGVAICECVEPFSKITTQFGSNDLCHYETAGNCPAGTRFRGYSYNGEKQCNPVNCYIHELNQGCAPGGWIVGIGHVHKAPHPNSCYVESPCIIGKDGNEDCKKETYADSITIQCDQNICCCYETQISSDLLDLTKTLSCNKY